MLWLNMAPLYFLSLSVWNSLFLHNNWFGVHIHLFSPKSVLLLTCLSKLPPTDLCNNVWYCFRNAVSARGGGVSGPGNSNENPVYWQRHAQSTTRGRPCQQVSNLCPSKGCSVVLTQGLYVILWPLYNVDYTTSATIIHSSIITLTLTVAMNNYQTMLPSSAVKPLILTFMWMSLDRDHLPQPC